MCESAEGMTGRGRKRLEVEHGTPPSESLIEDPSGAPIRHSGENRNPGFDNKERRMNLDSGFRRSDGAEEVSAGFD